MRYNCLFLGNDSRFLSTNRTFLPSFSFPFAEREKLLAGVYSKNQTYFDHREGDHTSTRDEPPFDEIIRRYDRPIADRRVAQRGIKHPFFWFSGDIERKRRT